MRFIILIPLHVDTVKYTNIKEKNKISVFQKNFRISRKMHILFSKCFIQTNLLFSGDTDESVPVKQTAIDKAKTDLKLIKSPADPKFRAEPFLTHTDSPLINRTLYRFLCTRARKVWGHVEGPGVGGAMQLQA